MDQRRSFPSPRWDCDRRYEAVARPDPNQGVASALRRAYAVNAGGLPDEMDALLARLDHR